MPLRLYSRRVLVPSGIRPSTIVVREGLVTAVETGPPHPDARDLGDLVLLPGLVDTHVHVNEPGRTEWEGYESATRAAALGGVTTLADMPLNSSPVTTSLRAFEAKLSATRGKLFVDVGFWGGVVPGNTAEIVPMIEAGVRGFKCFLCPSGIDEFPEVGQRDLLEAMPVLRDASVPLLVHAELELPLREAIRGDATEYATYLHSRPPEWEDAAVALVVDLVRQTGCRAHIVHLSSAGALSTLRQAKAEGLPVSAETCPHYLCLSAEEVPRGATSFKCAPPIRGRANQDQLWGALAEGVIDFVVTDHSPCLPSLKLPEEGDFLRAWGGISSLQLGLAAVWSEASRRGHSLLDVQRWLGPGPARLLGVARGALVEGAAADLIAFEDNAPFVVEPSRLAHKNPISAYAGRSLRGLVRHVWLRGTPIVEDGAIVGPPAGEPLLA